MMQLLMHNKGDPIYEITELLDPVNARSLKPKYLTLLYRRFPNLNTMCNRQKADKEWRDHASLPPSLFKVETSDEVKKLSVESYWGLPFSNAIAERAFSKVDQVKTPLRNNLHNVSLPSLILAQQWLKNQQASSAFIEVPEGKNIDPKKFLVKRLSETLDDALKKLLEDLQQTPYSRHQAKSLFDHMLFRETAIMTRLGGNSVMERFNIVSKTLQSETLDLGSVDDEILNRFRS
ncbi:Uncharacterized protein APZ42_012774 [Daphnia magna]|uniref:HAT C-terminal dimerisation domain-containing protein n=1 Tax=Daphnia magna TaxID=35525 RepID=A0A162RHM0_9CRUS|nr:Uncharacterized protein APZ42_012774 [Daphnia magna]